MPDQPQLIYLEPDDEITSVVRRLRAAEGSSVVIVAPGRSRATSSSVALRLLAQVAVEEKRSLSLVADASTRAVAGEAGIAAFASVAEATSGSAPSSVAAAPRAPINVVRGLPPGTVAGPAEAPLAHAGAGDETMAVRLPPTSARSATGSRQRRRWLLPKWPWLAGLLVIFLAGGAVAAPGATVSITPATQAVGPKAYQLHLPIVGHQTDELRVTRPGTATGVRIEQVAASGTVTFFNWSLVAVPIEEGTQVSIGGTIAFATLERIVVQKGRFNGQTIRPGQGSVGVVAVSPGPAGNVSAGAIDTVDDSSARSKLRGSPDNPNSLVTNLEPTAGGLETPHSVILQSDVDAVVAALQADLASQLAAALGGQPDRVYADAPATEVPQIDVPGDLVGTEDTPTFELTGALAFDRAYVARTDVDAAATAALLDDATAAPAGTSVLPDSTDVEIGVATVNGSQMTISVSVRAAAAPAIDEAAVRDLVVGMKLGDARAALDHLGEVEISVWPDWLTELPRMSFRISVHTVAPSPGASPSP